MTTLALEDTFIAPVGALDTGVVLGQYQQSVTTGARTEVRTYAGGRRRIIKRPGETEVVSVAYRYIDRDDYYDILDLVGMLVLFRDQRQRAVYGILSDVAGTEFSARDLVEDVSFTVTEVSYSEVV
jgi:hypothetical protein